MGKKLRSPVETNSPIGAKEKEAELQLFAHFDTFFPLFCCMYEWIVDVAQVFDQHLRSRSSSNVQDHIKESLFMRSDSSLKVTCLITMSIATTTPPPPPPPPPPPRSFCPHFAQSQQH
ncbi:hypothetical protein T07_9234 [Trichinella nelsoni]|uniref:Uncharacterized protein n=1 Tax=Trichinella nelsoni TaxID=6336 RepID=A0A0V0SHS8_9BILA|nr:hypothetical protein T07_9234 [Trichinella nelsoni]